MVMCFKFKVLLDKGVNATVVIIVQYINVSN